MALDFPTNPSDGDTYQNFTYDATYGVWNPTSSGGGASVTAYANTAAFPSADNTTGDMAFAEDTKALYVWDGTEWDRVYSGANQAPEWTTEIPSLTNLDNTGITTTLTVAAIDAEGFDITYDYDISPSNQTQATIVNNNDGTFTLTPSTDTNNAGEFTFRAKATDGLNYISSSGTVTLAFSADITLANGQVSYFGPNKYKHNNLDTSQNSGDNGAMSGTLKSGKHYIEVEIISFASNIFFGTIMNWDDRTIANSPYNTGSFAGVYNNGQAYPSTNTIGRSLVTGDVVQIAYDTTTRKVYHGVNNTWFSGDPVAGTGGLTIAGTSGFAFGFTSGGSFGGEVWGGEARINVGVNSGYRNYSPPIGYKPY
jgi:hypothetical protein